MYAGIPDLVDAYGEAEIIRLTTAEGMPMDAIDIGRAERALNDASGIIDSYLRKRYQVPMDVAPSEVRRSCEVLARHALAHGGGRQPTDQMASERKVTIAWLENVARGLVLLDGAIPSGDASYAQAQTRDQVFS